MTKPMSTIRRPSTTLRRTRGLAFGVRVSAWHTASPSTVSVPLLDTRRCGRLWQDLVRNYPFKRWSIVARPPSRPTQLTDTGTDQESSEGLFVRIIDLHHHDHAAAQRRKLCKRSGWSDATATKASPVGNARSAECDVTTVPNYLNRPEHQTRKKKVASSDEAVEQEDGRDTSTWPLFEAGFSLRVASRSSNWSERSSIRAKDRQYNEVWRVTLRFQSFLARWVLILRLNRPGPRPGNPLALSLESIDWLNWDFLQGRFASCFLFVVPCFLQFSSYKRSKCVSSTRNYLFSSAWIEYEKDGVGLLVVILHCQSQVCMAWTGLVNQLLFLSYSHDKWRWRLLPSPVDKSMLYLSSRVQLKYSSKTNCQRVAYLCTLVEAQCKIYNNESTILV